MRRRIKRRGQWNMQLEPLEDRRLMTTFVVSNFNDAEVESAGDLPGSLRQAIFDANETAGPDTIVFATNPGRIELTAGSLHIKDSLTISGPGATDLTIDGLELGPVLNLDDANSNTDKLVVLDGVTLTGGVSYIGGGAIRARENLIVSNSTLMGNTSAGSLGNGGAIYTYRNLTIVDSTITNNFAIDRGGAIYSANGGMLTIRNSDVSGNTAEISGGAVYALYTDVEIAYTSLDDNRTEYVGGAIAANSERVSISDSYVRGNHSNNDGGGIFANGDVTITRSTISANFAVGRFSDGGGIFSSGVLHLHDSNVSENFAGEQGGGVYAADLSIQGSTLTDNNAELRGGGVYAIASNYVDISDSLFEGNSTNGDRGDGGGMALINVASSSVRDSQFLGNRTYGPNSSGGAIYAEYSIRVEGTTIANNGVDDGDGGGVYSHADVILVDVSVLSNHANRTSNARGGGIYAVGDIDATRITVQGNIALSSVASGAGGGLFSGSELSLADSTVEGNLATGDDSEAGGILAGRATIQRSTISQNQADNGAGIVSRGAITVEDSTISGNDARTYAGGLLASGPIVLTRSTITENTAFSGGGVGNFSASPIALRNSIVANNTGLHADIISYQNEVASASYSLIGDVRELTLAGVGNITGVSPQLAPLANNGGLTKTHLPMQGSPVVDAGDPDSSPGDGSTPAFDQRGAPFSRVVDGGTSTRIDIGAVELQPQNRCDLDGDGLCDVNDLDALIGEIVFGTIDPSFDLTGDGIVNLSDRDEWLAIAGAINLPSGQSYLLGDANLDGAVDGADFIEWNLNKFQNVARWSAGDFNADGAIDGQDFILWNDNKFQASDNLDNALRSLWGLEVDEELDRTEFAADNQPGIIWL